ncbi:CoA pyrophosphatase [Bacillus sp. S/N-304-OC-R1]|uniref:NUDIX hydrolase n=1 Tax=Bacillus sp. S/N-304-OC-R1 TaxID=2758034 RepID=UPI001C8ED486|nr:CoA pyrophosphatase [Bacillus sp. S/N-304-OC-R1]MBY0123156.1 CoA pyrophosphatase [Bacillus sp. S/N-304-OC-R1]
MELKKIMNKLENRTPAILGSDKFSKYAILIPLIQRDDGLHILFEVRSLQLRRQPGEICFPGGRVDKTDKDERHTAIRETSEELGISESSIDDVYPLDYMISPFGTMIYPFVGLIRDSEEIEFNRSEVEEIFTVPLSFLKNTKPETFQIQYRVEPEKGFPFSQIAGGENYNWQIRNMEECFYYYEDRVIWGLTARVLKHFIEIVQS